jgi:hypothetical protein
MNLAFMPTFYKLLVCFFVGLYHNSKNLIPIIYIFNLVFKFSIFTV